MEQCEMMKKAFDRGEEWWNRFRDRFYKVKKREIQIELDFNGLTKNDKVIYYGNESTNNNISDYGIESLDLVLTTELIPNEKGFLHMSNYRVMRYQLDEKGRRFFSIDNQKNDNINWPASSSNIIVIGKVIEIIKSQ